MKTAFIFSFMVCTCHLFSCEQISLDQKALSKEIGTRLGNGPFTIKASVHGGDNKVFLVESEGDVIAVVKGYTKRTINEVNRIYEYSQLLETQMPVPHTIDKFLFQDHTPFVLQQFLPGQHVEKLNDKQLQEAAVCMGKIHGVKSDQWILNAQEFDYAKLIDQCCSFPEFNWILELYKSIDVQYLNDIPMSLIHGDISGSNLLFLGDFLSGVIDLDHIRYSYRLTDIARAQVFFSFDQDGCLEEQRIRSFINFYQKSNKCSQKEFENFYSHLKLLLIKMVLETYYYVEVKKEVSPEIFKQSVFNQSWQLLLKKLHAIEGKSCLIL